MTDPSNHELSPGNEDPTSPTRIDQAKFVASKLKRGAKRLFGHHSSDSASDSEEAASIFEDAAFDPQQIHGTHSTESESLRGKLYRGAHRAIVTVKSPERALRSKYTRKIAENLTGEPTAYDQGADEELVHAYDALERAIAHAQHHDNNVTTEVRLPSSTQDGNQNSTPDVQLAVIKCDVEEARTRLRQAQARRDSLKAGWVLRRYVKRVRIARPVAHPPAKPTFLEVSPIAQRQSLWWDKYLGQTLLWHTRNFTSYYIDDLEESPFDLKEFTLTFERLAAASASCQNFLVEVRKVYLWEQPRRTLAFMVAYWGLCHFQQLITAVFLWIIYTTARNRVYPSEIETIRGRIQRIRDDHGIPQAWDELIQRHGRHDWVEPFLDEVGPAVQLRVSDITNFLETVQSFYAWERPHKTAATLFLFSTCLLTTLLTDMNFCVRVGQFGVGLMFFLAFPVSSRYPKYRKVFNPLNWIFWDIPNSAELAIAQLQEKSIIRDAERLEEQEFHDCLEETPRSGRHHDVAGSPINRDSIAVSPVASDSHALEEIRNRDQISFEAINTKTHSRGHLGLERHVFSYDDGHTRLHRPYSDLTEIRKFEISHASDHDTSRTAKLAKRIEERTSLELLPSGIELDFLPTSPIGYIHDNPDCETLSLMVSAPDRDKIFALMLGWSNLKWQPHFSLNRRMEMSRDADHPTKQGKGNKDFDNVIGSFVK